MNLALIWLHVTGNLLWIGGIAAVGLILTGANGDAKTRGELGLRVYTMLAVPGFVLSFVCGAARLLLDPAYYLVQHHWMHGKLLFAFAAIGIHHVIGARAKKLARGTVQDAGPTAMLTIVLAATAVVAAFFAIFKLPN